MPIHLGPHAILEEVLKKVWQFLWSSVRKTFLALFHNVHQEAKEDVTQWQCCIEDSLILALGAGLTN